ncbi:hypothetical protein C922_00800 [Plasmodium inui San Antonio 1]|uniref:Uncharacterized protein n=1 Tax=Plasmodium inui San Antonio 1 TaxID=1237626 RepID=W7ACT1_9APIC|nr:hypothetical protein C922_00800 [Plasmodium inui San Antonio 1]EUD69108.1 hypothetical protein C922_00800 [Plasmodium inui San Antonio 1]
MEKESRAQKKKRKKDERQGSVGSEEGGGPNRGSSCEESGLDEGPPDNNDASDSQDEMSNLEDLPEYERELILAKRHEEHMIKEHRRILLKKVKPQSQAERTDQDDDANYVVHGGKSVVPAPGSKAALGKAKKKVAPPPMEKADVSGRPTKEGATTGKKQNKQNVKTRMGGTTASSVVEKNLHRSDAHDEFKKGKDSFLSQVQEKEATKREEKEKLDYQTDGVKGATKGDGVKGRRLNKVCNDTEDSSPSDDSSRRKKSVKKRVKKKETLHTQEGLSNNFDVMITSDERNELSSNDKGEKREDWNKKKKVLRKGSHLYDSKQPLRHKGSDPEDSGESGDSRGSRYSRYSRDGEKNKREHRTPSRSLTEDYHEGNKLFDDSKDPIEPYGGKGDPSAKETQTPERLIQLYKEEKKIKLEVYKYMTYEIITYFQLKKTFLLDMSEHINFVYHVIGHLVKVNDVNLMVRLAGGERIKSDPVGSNTVASNRMGSNPVEGTPLVSTAAPGKSAPTDQRRNAKEVNPPNEEGINTTSNPTNQNVKKKIFFITNVVKSENYFCVDRHTNVKFELAHLDNMQNILFFTRMKNQMIKNKRLNINEVTSHDNASLSYPGSSTFLCDLRNISDQKFSVDEYNCIKLFSIDLQFLKNFHHFLREKIEDLKNFRYTERQIEHLVEMKKKQSFHEIFSNRKSLDAVPISRITVQREICSIQREIDTLNYAKRRANPRDLHALSQLGHQIDTLTRKKDILKGQLQKTRTNLAPNRTLEGVHHEPDKTISKEKPLRSYSGAPLKSYRSAPLMEELPHKLLGVEERRGISRLANYIHEEKKSFINFVTGKFADLPLDVHNKIVSHFLLGCLQREQAYLDNPPADSSEEGSEEESGEDYHLFGGNK